MQILSYGEVKIRSQAEQHLSQLIRNAQNSFIKKYGLNGDQEYHTRIKHITTEMLIILSLFYDSVRKIKILDIGCGSVNSEDGSRAYLAHMRFKRSRTQDQTSPISSKRENFANDEENYPIPWRHLRTYEPWLCRFLYELGSKPIGVDINSLNQEDFEHYKLDLTKPDQLRFLPDNSIDIANCNSLFNSPKMLEILGIFDPPLKGDHKKIIAVKNHLIPQLERIVKTDGFFVFN